MTQQILPEKSPDLREFESLYKIWKLDHDASLPEFKIENVCFVHDPHWRDNWLSVQYVGDGERALIKGVAQPYISVFGAAEDLIFWTWFDYLNKKSGNADGLNYRHSATAENAQDKTVARANSLPPKLRPA